MKKILIITLLILSALAAGAQNKFYEKYADYKGVTKVYISQAMFSMFGTSPELSLKSGSENIDIGKIAKDLTGLYVLSTTNPAYIKEMSNDFKLMLKGLKLELLMEVNDEGDNVEIYVNKENNIIKDIYLSSKDASGEYTVMHISGRISEKDMMTIVKSTK
ncbi:MAG: DUF4252 domain-containing protein [Bacteroidales bacterium]|jgi:hypothetical protein